MPKASRDKGTRGELEVAAIFREHGFDVDRVPNSGGLRIKGDLYGSVPVHVEVKRQEVLRLPLWLRQAGDDCGGRVPVVAFRQNRGEWYAALPLTALIALVALEGELARKTEALRNITSPLPMDTTMARKFAQDALDDAESSKGRTAAFGAENPGSIPGSAAALAEPTGEKEP